MTLAFDPARFEANLARVRATLATHARRAPEGSFQGVRWPGGSPPSDLPRTAPAPAPTVVVVTKYLTAEATRWLRAHGHGPLGENRVQDLLAKTAEPYDQPEPRDRPELAEPDSWHFIGHLQRNKAGRIIGRVGLLHSLDSRRLAAALEEELARRTPARRLRCLVQVNVALEAAKGGLSVAAAEAEVPDWVESFPHLELCGLMTLPPRQDAERCRPLFRELRALRARVQARLGEAHREAASRAFCELSMGMSDDFPVAAEEGATLVRLGRVLFE